MTQTLRLIAESADDLDIISAALQDAIGRVGEMKWDSRARAFSLRLTRFRHEDETPSRVLTGLRFDSVLSVKVRGIAQTQADALAVLLSISFTPGPENPAGQIVLVFAGGGEIQLSVECIEARLADVSDARTTKSLPLHGSDDV